MHYVMVTRISKLAFNKWSNEVEIWQNLEKTQQIFLPIICGRKIIISYIKLLKDSLNRKRAIGDRVFSHS